MSARTRPAHLIYDVGENKIMTACGKDGEAVERAIAYDDPASDVFAYFATFRVHPCSRCLAEVRER